ncbi:YihY/virulence factor BrkB family protein [Nocardioides zeae]|uniref:YihY/virulence factor BrkB family protein n=1 Tax=Nocardioides imazamoxiresistens TaxID=3231893 RepID=A0ABU3PYL4_9ACTN|nr:YihY/virulence factor BrkB family protein [Nocardioides zeae]MDT9594340.1 YihY/virulence factor BrkB family protein [Nocardioides zeae]
MGLAGRIDRFQRRHPVLGAPLAVVYKYFDDQGPYLGVIISFYAFLGIFPLLLLATSIFGFVLQGQPELRDTVLSSTLSTFPIIGDQLGRPEGLQGSVAAIVVGSLAALYGATGLGQALQNAMNTAWAVPRNKRGNPFLQRFRSLVLLLIAGLAVLGVTTLSVIGNSTDLLGRSEGLARVLVSLATIAATGLVMSWLFRLSAARDHSLWAAMPGGFFTAVTWHLLQYAGAAYVTSVLARTSAMNQTFGLVLGLMGLIYAASILVVVAIEINVVLARRLYPRALLTPFTDAVDLTEADKRAYTAYARAQRHKGFEEVTVSFEKVTDDQAGSSAPREP